jgi:hypothetical protein
MKKFITIVLTVALFITAAALGVNSVFRVESLDLKIQCVSEEAKAEAQELREELLSLYEKESVFAVKQEDADGVLANYPYFRITSFKVAYPNKLLIEAIEDAEVFSVKNGESYYILSLDGTVLSVRETAENRSDNQPNVVISNMDVSGEKGQLCVGEKINTILPLLKELSFHFNGLRANLVSVEFQVVGGSIEQYNLTTREGVVIRVRQASELVQEKAERIAKLYASMEDGDRLKGSIYAASGNGNCAVVYYPTEIPLE